MRAARDLLAMLSFHACGRHKPRIFPHSSGKGSGLQTPPPRESFRARGQGRGQRRDSRLEPLAILGEAPTLNTLLFPLTLVMDLSKRFHHSSACVMLKGVWYY